MNTQEVRIPWVWDTTGVERGAQQMERAADRVKKATGAAGGSGAAGQANAGHGGGQLAWAMRDFMEGRTGYGIARLLNFAKGGLAATGVVFALIAGYKKLKEASEEASKAQEELNRALTKSREAGLMFGGRANTEQAIAAQGEAAGMFSKTAVGQMQGQPELNFGGFEGNQAVTNLNMRRSLAGLKLFMQDPMGNLLGGETGSSLLEQAEKVQKQQQEESVRQRQENYRRMRAGRGEEAEMIYEKGMGDPLRGKMKELEIAERIEKAHSYSVLKSNEEFESITEKYRMLQNIEKTERSIVLSKQMQAQAEAAVVGGAGSPFQKQMRLTRDRMWMTKELQDLPYLNDDQRAGLKLEGMQATNASNAALMGRYLDPVTGKRRPAREVHADFRRDRKLQRNQARFLRQISRGGFDPETGMRQTIHLGMAGENLGLPKGLGQGEKGSPKEMNLTLDNIKEILNSRLPKEVAK